MVVCKFCFLFAYKLSTIPGIEQTLPNQVDDSVSSAERSSALAAISIGNNNTTVASENANIPTDAVDQATPNDSNNGNETGAPVINGVRVCDDTRFKKYFSMKQFGVPAPAVKLKMEADGLDSTLLEYFIVTITNGRFSKCLFF